MVKTSIIPNLNCLEIGIVLLFSGCKIDTKVSHFSLEAFL